MPAAVDYARSEWEALTTPEAEREGRILREWRRLRGVKVWVEWDASAEVRLLLWENDRGPKGEGAEVLRMLMAICEQHGVVIRGSVWPYKPGSDENPSDLAIEKVSALYRSLGFEVDPSRGNGMPQFRYIPVSGK